MAAPAAHSDARPLRPELPAVELRMLADDLTGALDSAAAFAAPERPVAVLWHGRPSTNGAVAYDSASRELSADRARASVLSVAPALWSGTSGLAFKKVDSLLRGQEAAEIAAILEVLPICRCVVAPAFPAQGRITRDGRQGLIADGAWRPVPRDLAADLARAGHPVTRAVAGQPVPRGVSFWDAQSDADLDAIVARGRDQAGTLWIGSAGLAAALARSAGLAQLAPPPLPRPLLGLVGSEHDVIREQIARLGPLHRALALDGGSDTDLAKKLADDGVAFATVDLPEGTPRADANTAIEARFAQLLSGLDRPGTLFASGGETLRGLCDALGAERLDVVGQIQPGVPLSILRGGRWDGITIVSKSGAFGGPDLLKQLAANDPAAIAGAAA